MPADFERCLKRKGRRVKTKTLSGGRYLHICYIGDKSYAGEVHHKKNKKKSSNRARYKTSQ